jgi:aminopeptidase N
LRRMAYPTKEMEKWTDGRQERLVNTDDFLTIAEAECKCELNWFFEIYLRQPKLPRLVREGGQLRWETPNNMPFPMPIEVEFGGRIQKVEMKDGRGSFSLAADNASALTIDPNGWVLKAQ